MKKRIYLDYAAATPMDAAVERTMRPYYARVFGNPSSVHRAGQEASAAVFHARQTIAQAIGADYKEIIFTGSATEANNIALRGVIRPIYNKIIISSIEHESVLETVRNLEREGLIEAVYIPVDREGIIDIQKFKAALDEKTILVSIQCANSQIGTIQPIKEIGAIINDYRIRTKNSHLLFHTDAVQVFQYSACNADDFGVDMMTLSAHKIYGPKGIGCLYIRDLKAKNHLLKSFIIGGGQERGVRSGTENVPAIVGFGAAVELAEKYRALEFKRVKALRDYFLRGLKKISPSCELNGSAELRLPNNANIYFPGRPAQDMCIELDMLGIAVSPGSACSSRAAQPSYVIQALGHAGDRPGSSIRFSFGRPTTKSDIDAVAAVLRRRFKK